MPIDDYTSATQLSTSATQLVVLIVNALLAFGIVWAIAWWRAHRQHAEAASASEKLDVPTAPGETVIRGVVETEDPQRPAITVTIWQDGTEQEHKKSWSYTWTETNREVDVEPFYLVVDSGARVRVEPGPDTFLVDALEITQRGNPRTRKAQLKNGETACVAGLFAHGYNPRTDARDAGGYRGALPSGMVMRRGRDRMLVSTEPLALRYERQLSAHRRFFYVMVAAFLAMNILGFGGTHLVTFFGENIDAKVVGTRTWVTRNKNSTTTHYSISGLYDAAPGVQAAIDDEVSVSAYSAAKTGHLTHVPFRVVRAWPYFHNVGYGATIGVFYAILAPVLALVLLLLYLRSVSAAREWYDRPKVVDTGPGRLMP